jgi:hypothetical protein
VEPQGGDTLIVGTPQSSGLSRFRTAALLAASMLVASAAAVAIAPAQGVVQPPTPTGVSASAGTDNSGLGGAVPTVLVQTGQDFELTVTLTPAGAAFKSDTTLALTPSLSPSGTPKGKFSPSSITMPAGVNSATFDVAYTAVDNGVVLTVGKPASKGKPVDLQPGSTAPFDVLKELSRFAKDDPRLPDGLGVGNADCTQTSTESACGILYLEHGSKSDGALSIGACTADLGCKTGSQVVQAIADLGEPGSTTNPPLYSASDPALLIYRCDKKLCSGKGINSYKLKVSFQATGPLDLTASPCVSKGVASDADGRDFCLDYVQSHRDNSGDALFYFLFTHDMRAST